MPAETRLSNKIRAYLRVLGWWTKKIHGNQFQAGLPDILCMRRGCYLWVETKTEGDILRPLQHIVFDEMRRNLAIIIVADNFSDFIDEYRARSFISNLTGEQMATSYYCTSINDQPDEIVKAASLRDVRAYMDEKVNVTVKRMTATEALSMLESGKNFTILEEK